MSASTNFYAAMFGVNDKKPEKPTEDKAANVVQDEALTGPWTHRFTIYCQNPPAEFLNDIKAKDFVVGTFEKTKETSTDSTPPDNQ